MASNNSTAKSPDRFHVGQTVAFVLDRETGHERYSGHLTTVRAARVRAHWRCADPAQPGRGIEACAEWRYTVDSPYGGAWHVAEYMLRAVYDGETLSTWDAFAQATGVRVAPTATRAGRGAEADHA